MERAHRPSAITPRSTGPQPEVIVSIDKVSASLPTGQAVEVLLHGATVVSWISGQENLWLSEKAVLDGSKPVRGGIPIVFPVFGPPPAHHSTSALPQHGFARNSKWAFLGKSSSEADSLSSGGDDAVRLDFGLESSNLSKESLQAWPYEFSLIYSVFLTRDSLSTNLNVKNRGNEAFDFQTLLHSYFRVKDISSTSVRGLLATHYVDKMLDATEHVEKSADISIHGEVDRVYTDIKQDTTSILEKGVPRFDITRVNLTDTVVWNPWIAKAAGMGDFYPKDGYKQMLCVEVGAVRDWQVLEPGESFDCGQVIKTL